jgi:hypothetical protein
MRVASSPMQYFMLLAALMLPAGASNAAQPDQASVPALTAEQIVERNVTARGGLEVWRRIRAMVWSGHMESSASDTGSMRFLLKQARPNRTRFEVTSLGQQSLRIFDGQRGWKVRPTRSIKPDVEPFSLQEVRFAQDAEVIDGPLIDFAAHGSRITLRGLEEEQGRPAWRIDVVRASGAQEAVWIDAETFLDMRYDRTSFRPSGEEVKVSLYFHDYRSHDGVQIPAVVEFGGAGGAPANRMVIEEVALNPELGTDAFAASGAAHRRSASNPDATRGAFGAPGAMDKLAPAVAAVPPAAATEVPRSPAARE